MKNIITFLSIAILFISSFSQVSYSYGGCGGGSSDYFTFEDLRDGLKQQDFWFANNDKPDDALVDLGYSTIYAANFAKRQRIAAMVSSNPGKYRVKISKAQLNWNDNNIIQFAWSRFSQEGGRRGDLIFLRANNVTSNLIKIFSNWTHVAIVENVKDKNVFEAMKDGGVNINYAPSKWNDITYFTCKRLKNLTTWQIGYGLDTAIRDFRYKPYILQFTWSSSAIPFIARWSDPNDMRSMYCSKLVYLTFKPFVDLDTQNTSLFNSELGSKSSTASLFSWMGVSPDDIYYSKELGKDFSHSQNVKYL